MQKRNCRRTETECIIHEKAVKLRKMTDEQLVSCINQQYNAGYEDGKKTACFETERIIDSVKNIKGIGAATVEKIRGVLTKLEGV